MKKLYGLIALAALVAAVPLPVFATVNVFACEPEWAALAREIGGERVEAYSATHANQDPHHIRARPSLIAKIRRADLVFCSGAGLEVGWLPLLLQRGGAAVQPGERGHFMAAAHVEVVETPVILDRSLGDLHPEGNPHVHLDPRNVQLLARELAARLSAIDPGEAEFYAQRLHTFEASWSASMAGWNARAKALSGAPVIVHHKSWSYLLRWIGLQEIAVLEAKPGILPSPAYLGDLLKRTRSQPAKVILRTPYDDAAPSEWLSQRTSVPALELPMTVDRDAGVGALMDLFERLLSRLEDADVRP